MKKKNKKNCFKLLPGSKDEKKNGPLKERIIHDIMNNLSKEIPLVLEPGSLHTSAAPTTIMCSICFGSVITIVHRKISSIKFKNNSFRDLGRATEHKHHNCKENASLLGNQSNFLSCSLQIII